MSQENVEMVKQSAKRWNSLLAEDDLDGLRALVAEQYHPEVEVDWSATVPEDVGSAGGIEAIINWLVAVRESVEELRFEPLNVIEVGDALVIYMRVTARTKSSGVGVAVEYAYVNRFKDKKIILSRTYQTLPEALEGAWGEE